MSKYFTRRAYQIDISRFVTYIVQGRHIADLYDLYDLYDLAHVVF